MGFHKIHVASNILLQRSMCRSASLKQCTMPVVLKYSVRPVTLTKGSDLWRAIPRLLPLGWRLQSRTVGSGFAGIVVLLPLPPTPVEEAAHHQYHRTQFRGGSPSYSAHGPLRKRAERGSHHLLHLSSTSTWNGKSAPSAFLHKQLDVTFLWNPTCNKVAPSL